MTYFFETVEWNIMLFRISTNDPTFTTLNVHGEVLGTIGTAALARALDTNTHLIDIDIGHCYLGIDGMKALCPAIKKTTTLRNLKVMDNAIEDKGAIALAEALQINTSLRVLDISANDISQRGGFALCEAFRKNFMLESLNLDGNLINQECIITLAEILKNNTTLIELNLHATWIQWFPKQIPGQESIAMKAICQMLETNTTLRVLEVGDNHIDYLSMDVIVKALTINQTLYSLDLSVSALKDEGIIRLSKVLATHKTLRKIDLVKVYITEVGAKVLYEMLKTQFDIIDLPLMQNGLPYDGLYRDIATLIERNRRNPTFRANELRKTIGSSPVPSLLELSLFAIRKYCPPEQLDEVCKDYVPDELSSRLRAYY